MPGLAMDTGEGFGYRCCKWVYVLAWEQVLCMWTGMETGVEKGMGTGTGCGSRSWEGAQVLD